MSVPQLVEIAGWLVAGLAFGLAYLWLVARNVAAIVPPVAKFSALRYFALRLALAAGALWLAASHGALPLLLLLLGFLVSRTIVIHRIRGIDDGD